MMIDFALEAERKEHKSAAEAIHQACLLRFRPIMMTTMAALLGAVPLALGTDRLGAAAAAGHHDRRRAALQPAADAVHDAGDLPVLRRAWPRRSALRQRADASSRRGQRPQPLAAEPSDEPFLALHPAAGRHDAADGRGRRWPARWRFGCFRSRRCRRWIFRPSPSRRSLPGASPEIMASSVATPLERQFGRIAGVTEMTSSSTLARPASLCSSI